MVNAHPLDLAYDTWWSTPVSNDDLFAEVLRHARRLCRDDDAAQEVCIFILTHLETFRRRHASSFSRWVMSVCRRRRLEAVRRLAASRSAETFTEDDHTPVDDYAIRDYNSLPSPMRAVAFSLASGMTLEEVACALSVKPKTVQKKVQRHVAKMTS